MSKTSLSSNRALPMGFAVAAAMLALSGCTRIYTHQGYRADNLLEDSVKPGIDNRESVEGTLGRPSFTSQFDGGRDYYYVSRDTRQLAFANPRPVGNQVLRVRFDKAGNVVAVNRAGMDKVASIKPSGDKTPTLGRDRTLWEDIFGNIGAVGAGAASGGGNGDNTGPNGS